MRKKIIITLIVCITLIIWLSIWIQEHERGAQAKNEWGETYYRNWEKKVKAKGLKVEYFKEKQEPTIDDLLDAIAVIESGNDPNAYNEKEDAVGILQIRKIMVDDVNRILRLQGKDSRFGYYARRFENHSRDMAKIYFDHYCKSLTFEEKAACWCAGPDGWQQINEPKVRTYVDKVMKEMRK